MYSYGKHRAYDKEHELYQKRQGKYYEKGWGLQEDAVNIKCCQESKYCETK